jgi:long-chain fatty acid transport protein
MTPAFVSKLSACTPPVLNVHRLQRVGALIPGRSGIWRWLDHEVPLAGIGLRAEASRVVLLYRYGTRRGVNDIVRESVRLVRRPLDGAVTSFLCPGIEGRACRRRTANLYAAGPYFLCRKCAQSADPDVAQLHFGARRVEVQRIAASALATMGAAIASVQAVAGGFMVRENSAEGVATAFAGNGSRAATASTAFNNPAGMTRLGYEIEIGTAGILPSIEFDGDGTMFGVPISGNEGGDAGVLTPVPNAYWVFGTGPLKAGLAVTAPFGNGVEYEQDWFGRYLATKLTAFSIDINPSLAYRISDSLSVAAGVSAQYLKFDYSAAIPQFVIFGPGTPDASHRFTGDSWSYGFNVGAMLELSPTTRVGLTFRSGVDHSMEGNLDFTGLSPLLGMVSGPAAADVHLPLTGGLSVTTELTPNFSLSADAQWTRWSVFERVVIESQNPDVPFEQHYRDSWMFSIGGVFRLSDSFALRAGAGWDQTPVTDSFRAATLPDEDRILVAGGFELRLSDSFVIDAAYQHAFTSSRADMNASFNKTDPITHAVTLNGDYGVGANIVALSLRYRY